MKTPGSIKLLYLLFALFIFALTGCGANNLVNLSNTAGNHGSVTAKTVWGEGKASAKSLALSVPVGISSIQVTITGSDAAGNAIPVVRGTLPLDGSQGSINNIYPGRVSMSVKAFNGSALAYDGFAVGVAVNKNATSNAGTIVMSPPMEKPQDAACIQCHETTLDSSGQNLVANFKQSGHYTNTAWTDDVDFTGIVGTGCAGCHGPSHNITDPSGGGRCWECHGATLEANHQNIGAATTTCTSCHQAHNPSSTASTTVHSVNYTGSVGNLTLSGSFTPLAGSTVTTIGLTPAITATTNTAGVFVLPGIPQNATFSLHIISPSYIDIYTGAMSLTSDYDSSGFPYGVVSPQTFTNTFGNTAGNGMIRTRVVQSTATNTANGGFVGGAVVTATDTTTSATYPVMYTDNTTGVTGNALSSTDPGNGIFTVVNIPAGHTVSVTASKPGYTFNTRTYTVEANAVSEGKLTGTAIVPNGAPFISATVLSVAGGSNPIGWLQNVKIATDSTQSTEITNATVTVNGTPLTYSNGNDSGYKGNVAIAAGATVTLNVTIGSTLYTATGTQYSTFPSITAPVSGAVWQGANPNTISWTAGAPSASATYVLGVFSGANGNTVFPAGNGGPLEVPTSSLSYNIPANSLTAGNYAVMLGIGTPGIGSRGAGMPIANTADGSGLYIGGIGAFIPITVQ